MTMLYRNIVRSIIIMCCALLTIAQAAHAADVTLAWDASTSPITGYRLYYGQATRPVEATTPAQYAYPYHVTLGNVTQTTVQALGAGLWAFTVTAYDTNNESVFSNEVSTTIAGYTPPIDALHPIVLYPQAPVTIHVQP